MLICDGCGKTCGENGEYRTAVESRAAARGLGWILAPKRRRDGTPGGRTDDICAECAPRHHCPTCNGAPPAGFSCNDCGRGGA